MRKRGLGVALIVAVVIGILVVALKPQGSSVEDHLRGYYAARWRQRAFMNASLSPTLRSKVAMYWYKLRGKNQAAYLNQMAKHYSALEDLGYFETQTFVVSNRSALYVRSNVWRRALSAGTTNILDGLANIWTSTTTNHVYVVAPKTDMPKWEGWINESDVPE